MRSARDISYKWELTVIAARGFSERFTMTLKPFACTYCVQISKMRNILLFILFFRITKVRFIKDLYRDARTYHNLCVIEKKFKNNQILTYDKVITILLFQIYFLFRYII